MDSSFPIHLSTQHSEVRVIHEFKYLGVHISDKCVWQKHIQRTASKGSQMLRFIKINFRDCPQAANEIMYMSLVRPLLEYASCVWDPCAEGMKHDLEMVQRRAARFVLNDYDRHSSVTDMLSSNGWKTLETRRREARLCLMFNTRTGGGGGKKCPPLRFFADSGKTAARSAAIFSVPDHNWIWHLV